MIHLVNQSLLSAALAPGWNLKRQFQMTLVIKASCQFDNNGKLKPLESPLPLVEADEYLDDPETSSLSEAYELQPFKQHAEFYLYGKAYPRQQGDSTGLTQVKLQHRSSQLEKTLVVLGEHHWKRGLFGITRSKVSPLQPLDLTYELTWGGQDQNTAKTLAANPAGQDYYMRFWQRSDSKSPQIEYENHFSMRMSRHNRRVAGYGPLPGHWFPRNSRFGQLPDADTLDKTLCPWGPDVDPLLHQMAPDDQQFAGFYEGGETLTLCGFFPDTESINVKLPHLVGAPLQVSKNEKPHSCPLKADTLVINTEQRQLSLIYRYAIQAQHLVDKESWVYLPEDLSLNLEEIKDAQ